jgi:acyltransferase
MQEISSKSKRIYWVDNLKVIGILLVMIGHMESINPYLAVYIYSFHVPLFFFISGFLFHPEKYQGPREFITRKIFTLILPYFFFCIPAYGLLIIIENLIGGKPFSYSSLFNVLFIIIHANAYYLDSIFNGPLWFLPCLFLVEIEFYLISFLKKGIQLAVIVLLFGSGIILGHRFEHLPWSFAASLTALLFYYLGFFLQEKIPSLDDYFKPIIIILEVIISLVFFYLNGPIFMVSDNYGNNILYFILSAQAGIIFLTILTTYTKPNKLLSYLGANTLIILGLHAPLDRILSSLIAYFNLQGLYSLIPYPSFDLLDSVIPVLNQTVSMLFLLFVQLLIISLLIPIINKKLYFFLGREKLK